MRRRAKQNFSRTQTTACVRTFGVVTLLLDYTSRLTSTSVSRTRTNSQYGVKLFKSVLTVFQPRKLIRSALGKKSVKCIRFSRSSEDTNVTSSTCENVRLSKPIKSTRRLLTVNFFNEKWHYEHRYEITGATRDTPSSTKLTVTWSISPPKQRRNCSTNLKL